MGHPREHLKKQYPSSNQHQAQVQASRKHPGINTPGQKESEDWRSDQVWTFMTAYLEDMFIPREG